ncbi:MAG TPA: DUF4056 domain-containing protein [Candidatus Limnocylindrales bacterium]|nr:DUF4056 domain-containing protein [Candidatus Limnocylindrales bacterium]
MAAQRHIDMRPDAHVRSARPAARLTFAVLLLVLSSCAARPRWHSDESPAGRDTARLFRPEGALGAPRDPYAGEIAEVPMRVKMRPCCAFGAQLRVRVGPVPVPLYFFGNMVDRRKLRHHVYDSGSSTFGSRGGAPELLHSEENGLIYSCRAGFLDVAHIRDNADAALYLITAVARNLESGGDIPLPSEGAKVHVALQPIDPATLSQEGRWAIAIPLGQWLAFQSSVWHEIVTWFGWSTFTLFPEKVSSFSPEDLYSDLLGARIAAAVVSQRGARDEFAYNRNMDQWLDRSLELVGSVPAKTAEEAMLSVDGLWWDSTKRIPDVSLVLRRNFDGGPALHPWLVPGSRMGPKLRAACGENPSPMPIDNPDAIDGIDFDGQASLVIDLPDELASREPFRSIGRRLTQKDFSRIVAFIRDENGKMFGPDADKPDAAEPR